VKKPPPNIALMVLHDELFWRCHTGKEEMVPVVREAVEAFWTDGGEASYADVIDFEGYEQFVTEIVERLTEDLDLHPYPMPIYCH
jgi:dissimilatory sulfite reductase (desulfoviridin) alpha/beta subunit